MKPDRIYIAPEHAVDEPTIRHDILHYLIDENLGVEEHHPLGFFDRCEAPAVEPTR